MSAGRSSTCARCRAAHVHHFHSLLLHSIALSAFLFVYAFVAFSVVARDRLPRADAQYHISQCSHAVVLPMVTTFIAYCYIALSSLFTHSLHSVWSLAIACLEQMLSITYHAVVLLMVTTFIAYCYIALSSLFMHSLHSVWSLSIACLEQMLMMLSITYHNVPMLACCPWSPLP